MGNSFSIERLVNCRQYIHFHTHLEIYGVSKGRAAFIISGERKVLTEGQMAIVGKHENHSVETQGESMLLVLRVDSSILGLVSYAADHQKLPCWLMDGAFNKELFERVDGFSAETKDPQSELRITSLICQLLADIIEHYGMENVSQTSAYDVELVEKTVQYIYEHYSEKITLETLANRFHISPSVLSRKLRKRLGVDLRVFVNDVRVQKAVQMLNEPEHKNQSIYEIAMQCGFSSMSTFYRCYKRNFSFGTLREKEEIERH